jgi:hypothetical protein
MIANLRNVCDSFGTVGIISKEKLENALRDLCKKGKYLFRNSYALFIFFNLLKSDMILLYIRAQNARVIISKVGDLIHVKTFKLSSLN